MHRRGHMSSVLYMDSPVDPELQARVNRRQAEASPTKRLDSVSEYEVDVAESQDSKVSGGGPEQIIIRPRRPAQYLSIDTHVPRDDWFNKLTAASAAPNGMLRSAYNRDSALWEDRGELHADAVNTGGNCDEFLPNTDTSAAWAKCAKNLWDHDEVTVKGWKEEIDTLLVFAGLFSAVLTAFLVQSYPMLQPDEFPSSSSPSSSSPSTSSSAIWINALWFSGLICSLASAIVGISIKQWLNHYTSRVSTMSRQSARIRQHRHNGLVKWHVGGMMSLLPVLLQTALIVFLIGILLLLWQLNIPVACVTTVLVAVLLLFTLTTLVLPAFAEDCPYKSPQAWWFFLFWQWIQSLRSTTARCIKRLLRAFRNKLVPFVPNLQIQDWLDSLIELRCYANWREREMHFVGTMKERLDPSVVTDVADATMMDDGFLEEVVRPCLNDIPLDGALASFYAILKHRAHKTRESLPDWSDNEHDGQAIATMSRMAIDVFSRIEPDYVDATSNQKRILVLMDRLFDAGHVEKAWGRLLGKVTDLLKQDDRVEQNVRDYSFRWIEKLSMHNHIDAVECHDVKAVIAYLTSIREDNEGSKFLRACLVAAHLSASLPSPEFQHIHDSLQTMFASLETFLSTPAAESVVDESNLIYLLFFLPSIVHLVRQDKALMTGRAVELLSDVFERTLTLLAEYKFRPQELLASPRVQPIRTDLQQLREDLSVL
ncbi:hypothetical protein B0H21DRAFT_505635 [Amylocystis lapponica]|nr:hypothetical protein B0H21DRAFT_505635 [Amylocystis lapponica]